MELSENVNTDILTDIMREPVFMWIVIILLTVILLRVFLLFLSSDRQNRKYRQKQEQETVKNILAHDLHIFVNNDAVTLHGKADYIFVDIFDVIDFDLSKPNGRSIVTTLNGATPDYMQAIHEGDKIEVYWK